MAAYKRNFAPGGTYFFTVVTANRRPILTTDLGRQCLRESIQEIRSRFPFDLFAISLLPDHFHAVWILPESNANFPTRMQRIKSEFTRRYLERGGTEVPVSNSRLMKKERGIWQRRYWEHTVRDEIDLKNCVDYIHWNPCKHRLVECVSEWPWSSFHRYRREGEYDESWGRVDPCLDGLTPDWSGCVEG